MKNRRIIIGLHADNVRVLHLRSGKIVTHATVSIGTSPSPEDWEDSLRRFDDPLRSALEEAGVSDHTVADVVYDSPTASVGASIATSGTKSDTTVALLELESKGNANLQLQPHAAWVIGGNANTQPHCVAVTDLPTTVDTLARWLERAGFTMRACLPTEVIGVSGALSLHNSADSSRPRVTCWLGHSCSGVVVGSQQGVHFARSSPLTTDALVSAISDDAGTHTGLTPDIARRLLIETGIPSDSNERFMSAKPEGCNTHTVRAAMQPLLQRTAVDLRQALRFGLGNELSQDATLIVGGSASAIPDLVPLLSELVGFTSTENADFADEKHTLNALDHLGLVSDASASQDRSSMFQKAMIVGTAVALAVSVGQGLLATNEAAASKEALVQLRSGTEHHATIRERQDALEASEAQLARIERSTTLASGFGPRWPGWLVDVAQRRDERIFVHGMTGIRNKDDSGTITLSGIVDSAETPKNLADAESNDESASTPSDTAHEASHMDLLRAFIASLESSPLVSQVKLGPTRRGGSLGEGSTSFELVVMLVSAPVHVAEVPND